MISQNYLEAEIAGHCTLDCGQCSHHSPFIDIEYYGIDQFEKDVTLLAQVMNVNYFRLLGGEPLLALDILDYVEIAKKSQLSKKVGICTNGILLSRVDENFLNHIDFIDITLYPVNSTVKSEILENVKRLKSYSSQKVVLRVKDKFRFSNLTTENKDKNLLTTIWNNCRLKNSCHAIYRGYYFLCMTSRRKGQYIQSQTGEHIKRLFSPNSYGVELTNDCLETRLQDYISSSSPMFPCHWCLGTSGKLVSHKQRNHLSVNNVEEIQQYLD